MYLIFIVYISFLLSTDDLSWVILPAIPGVEGSEYINACTIDVSWDYKICFSS